MAKFVEVCYVDKKGVHNKLYKEGEKEQLAKDVELIEKLIPNVPIRLLGRHKDTGKPLCLYRGAEFNWKDTQLIVAITFGDKQLFTYTTSKYVEVGDGFQLVTPHGISYGVVASPCKRKTNREIALLCKSLNIGGLKNLQDCIAKEGD